VANEITVKKKLNAPRELDFYAVELDDELGSEHYKYDPFEHLGSRLPEQALEVVHSLKDEGSGVVSVKEETEIINIKETIIMDENTKVNQEGTDKVKITDQIEVTEGTEKEPWEEKRTAEEDALIEKVTKLVEGKGAELRVLLVERGYTLKLGVTNKMLEKYAVEEFKTYLTQTYAFSPEYINSLGERLVGIGYAEKVRQTVEKQPENKEDIPTVNIKTETKQIKAEIIKPQNMENEEYDNEKVRRLKAKGWLMDRIDFSILLLRSAQWAFILVLIGVAGQAFHVYHVVDNLSDLNGWMRIMNNVLWATFLSFGLVYFTLKLGKVKMNEPAKVMKYQKTVGWFISFDIFANLYYWSYKFVLMPAVLDQYMKEFVEANGNTYRDVDWAAVNWMTFDISKVQWPQMIAGTIFAFSIPYILKAFAGEIDLPARLDNIFRSYKKEISNEQ
jgi:hypothetical protein